MHSLNGCALHEMIFDDAGRPADCRFLAVNPAFERMTGLVADEIIGRTVLEVLPGTEPHWIENYGRVTLTGEPFRFESYHAGLRKYFDVAAFRPQAGQFACVFSDVTAHVEREKEIGRRLNRLNAVLAEINQSVVRAGPREELFAGICGIAAEIGHFSFAWIGMADPASGEVKLAARADRGWQFPHQVEAGACGIARAAIDGNRAVVCNAILPGQSAADCHELARQAGIASCAAFPITCGGRARGVLCVHATEEGFFNAAEVKVLEETALDISFALDKLESDAARERSAAIIRENEAKYRRLFDNMIEGFTYCQMIFEDGQPADFIYLDVNPAFEALTGLRDVVGKRATEVIPGVRESDPGLLEIYGRVASGGKPERFEKFIEALGEWYSASVYSPASGYFVSVFDVITQRKEAEEALRESEAKFSKAFGSSPVMMAITTLKEGAVLEVNQGFHSALGFQREDLIGKTLVSAGVMTCRGAPANRLIPASRRASGQP